MQRQSQQPAKSTGGRPGSFTTKTLGKKPPVTHPNRGRKSTRAFTHSASLTWQRVQRAGVTPVRAWTIPLTTAQQVPVAVQPASDPGRQSQGNRETPHSSQHVSSTTGMTESAPFGTRCRYLHCCSRCKGSHPVKRCPLAATCSKEKSMKF